MLRPLRATIFVFFAFFFTIDGMAQDVNAVFDKRYKTIKGGAEERVHDAEGNRRANIGEFSELRERAVFYPEGYFVGRLGDTIRYEHQIPFLCHQHV